MVHCFYLLYYYIVHWLILLFIDSFYCSWFILLFIVFIYCIVWILCLLLQYCTYCHNIFFLGSSPSETATSVWRTLNNFRVNVDKISRKKIQTSRKKNRCVYVPVYTLYILSLPNTWSANRVFQFRLQKTIDHAWDMYACKFDRDYNALMYGKLYAKLEVVCSGISQDITVYAYIVDKVNGLHIVFSILTTGYDVRCVGNVCINIWTLKKNPSSIKILRVIISIFPGIP